jgi:hypothetical protein
MAAALLTVLALGLHGPAGLGSKVGRSGVPQLARPARLQPLRATPSDEMSDAEQREKALAEGELPMPTPMARSAFAMSDDALRPPGAPLEPTSRSDLVNSEIMTKVTNSIRNSRWSDEPIMLSAVKTFTWVAIGLAVIFEIYLALFVEHKPSDTFS